MKNIVLIIIAFAMLYSLQSQDKIDPIKIVDKSQDTIYNKDTTKFQIGWNWNSDALMSRLLGFNQTDSWQNHNPNNLNNNTFIFAKEWGACTQYLEESKLNVKSMQYMCKCLLDFI